MTKALPALLEFVTGLTGQVACAASVDNELAPLLNIIAASSNDGGGLGEPRGEAGLIDVRGETGNGPTEGGGEVEVLLTGMAAAWGGGGEVEVLLT